MWFGDDIGVKGDTYAADMESLREFRLGRTTKALGRRRGRRLGRERWWLPPGLAGGEAGR